MSYEKQLKEHYKAVKARLNPRMARPVVLLPPPTQKPSQVAVSTPSKPPEPGLFPSSVERSLVTDALRQANPEWVGGNYSQAIKIAEQMADAPKLPPLPGLVLNERGAVRWMRVLHAVAAHHNIDASEIMGTCRKRHVVMARFEVFYRLRVDLNYSYIKIGMLMKRDHTTILHGVNKLRSMLIDGQHELGEDGRLRADKHPSMHSTHTDQSAGGSPN